MRIALLDVRNPQLQLETLKGGLMEPIGLCWIGAVAKQAGHKVGLFQQASENNEEFIEQIIKFRPEIVGFSVMEDQYNNSLLIAKELKRQLEKIQVLFGGFYPSANPKIVKEAAIDFVIRGEGIYPTLKLLASLEERKDNDNLEKIESLCWQDKRGAIIINKMGQRMTEEQLNQLPVPLREGLPFSQYRRFALSYPPPSQMKYASVATAFGCPFHCTFCSTPFMCGKLYGLSREEKVYRQRALEKVISEIKELHQKYDINYLMIRDEEFCIDQERVKKFCRLMTKNNMAQEISWRCFARAGDLNFVLACEMKKGGCNEIMWGIESGDQQILNQIRKGIKIESQQNQETIYREIDQVRGAGIFTTCLFMIGYPNETRKSLYNTLEFIKHLPCDRIVVGFVTPYIGTQIYEQNQELIKEIDISKKTHQEVAFNTPCLPESSEDMSEFEQDEYLKEFRELIYQTFYNSPEFQERSYEHIQREPRLLQSYQEWFDILSKELPHFNKEFLESIKVERKEGTENHRHKQRR